MSLLRKAPESIDVIMKNWLYGLSLSLLRKAPESIDVIMKNWLYGLSLCQKILVVNRKNGCLGCFICTQ